MKKMSDGVAVNLLVKSIQFNEMVKLFKIAASNFISAYRKNLFISSVLPIIVKLFFIVSFIVIPFI